MKHTARFRSLVLTLSTAAVVAAPQLSQAQSSPTAKAASVDYEAQRKALKAARFGTYAEVKAAAKSLTGRTIELTGEIKGNISRTGGMAVLFQSTDSAMLVIEASETLKSNPSLRPGAYPRVLLRVDGVAGNDVALTLLNATEKAENSGLFHTDDDTDDGIVVVTPMTSMAAPQPSVVLNNPAPDVPGAPRPALSRTVPPADVRSAPQPATALATDPYQRQAYRSLARRYNPKLDDNSADYIAASLLSAASAQNLDPRFLAAVVSVESSFDPYCLSSSGAMGLGQLMPFNLKSLGVGNAWDPMQNLHGSARMLRNNLNRFGSYQNGTLLAVAAYHAGGNAVERAGFQVPPKPATQRYVWKVYYAYKALAPELFN